MDDAADPRVHSHEVDVDDSGDSSFGDNGSTYTETLRSSLLESLKENGRGYHKYRDGTYMLPEDEREQERLDMQHNMFLNTFGGKLVLAPVDVQVLAALDLGTGTGIWAIDYADEHPEATVLGVDLSPIQPTYLPPNCKFEVDDFENDWTYTHKFDLIHGRMLIASCTDFPKLIKQAYDALNPGGWIEFQDLNMPFIADDGTDRGTVFEEWNAMFIDACNRWGRDSRWTGKYGQWLIEAGFENVEEHVFKWPIGPWAKDKALKEMGRWNLVNMLDGIEGFSTRLFSKVYGMSLEEITVLLASVRSDLYSKKIHAYWPM